ncbi:MAG: hypothetical protein AAFU85_13445 [Planctomycetota bacterium]
MQALHSYIDDHPVGTQFQSALVQDFARIVVNDDPRIASTPLARLSVTDEYFLRIDKEAAIEAGALDPEYLDRVMWSGLRSPFKRNTDAPRIPEKTTYPVELLAYANAFGSTGWNADGFSKWVGFDFDGPNHSDGCTPEQLADVVEAVERLADPNVTLRTSKSGQGYHILYTFPERMKTLTGTHHAQLAAIVLNVMSERAGFDFGSVVDCGNGGGVLFHWSNDIAANGLTTLESTTTENLNNVQ